MPSRTRFLWEELRRIRLLAARAGRADRVVAIAIHYMSPTASSKFREFSRGSANMLFCMDPSKRRQHRDPDLESEPQQLPLTRPAWDTDPEPEDGSQSDPEADGGHVIVVDLA